MAWAAWAAWAGHGRGMGGRDIRVQRMCTTVAHSKKNGDVRFRFIQFVLVYTMLKSADPNQILSSCARGDGSGEPHHVLIGMGHVTTSYTHGGWVM